MWRKLRCRRCAGSRTWRRLPRTWIWCRPLRGSRLWHRAIAPTPSASCFKDFAIENSEAPRMLVCFGLSWKRSGFSGSTSCRRSCRASRRSRGVIGEAFVRQTIELAREARAAGDHPFGALLVLDGAVVLTARNTVRTDADPTAHAETNLVAKAICRLAPDEI